MPRLRPVFAALLATSLLSPAYAGEIKEAKVERLGADRVFVSWRDDAPVDVLLSTDPVATADASRIVVTADADGRAEISVDAARRPYLLLRDTKDGRTLRVAERLLPLQQGSNFRDLGGYATEDGHHVKWGRVYRAGATPVLTDADLAYVTQQLGVTSLVDLRSVEERQLAPTRLASVGVQVIANDYPSSVIFNALNPPPPAPGAPPPVKHNLYRDMPTLLKPQLTAFFQQLLAGKGGVEVNCSAGQDRTGLASALLLTMLGVPRGTIYRDYLLSTEDRRTEYELPKDLENYPDNPVAQFYLKVRAARPGATDPKPLYGPDGKLYLADAFDEIETKWGSVDNYMQQELGIGPMEKEKLRAMYLE